MDIQGNYIYWTFLAILTHGISPKSREAFLICTMITFNQPNSSQRNESSIYD